MTHEGVAISDGGQEVNMENTSMEETVAESPYCTNLEPVSRNRYKELVNAYVGRDPFLMKMSEFSVELEDLPTVEAVDITNYLVLQTSYYTRQQMKAYKSLEAYNFFVSGWVHNLGTKRLHDDHRLVFARTDNRFSEIRRNISEDLDYCEGGWRSHCSSLQLHGRTIRIVFSCRGSSFSIEVGVKMRDTASCTTEQCKWLMPSHVKKIPAAPVALIDFSSAKAKKKKSLTVLLMAGQQKTSYGCKHEAQARGVYEKLMGREHAGFSCMDSGLWLNPKWPYMGSSPDGIVACDCHGTGICEIKCPHSHQDEANLRLCAGEKGFCLINDGDNVMLDRTHDYYYQSSFLLKGFCPILNFGMMLSLKLSAFLETVYFQKYWDSKLQTHMCNVMKGSRHS
ncbi:uncharacterized protein LOC127632032 [Xyrauchen texanus]|uniref:uncharacterized protein LOC127632032 n=1 Tax=Xyrauchen texanus TaxID=154827 RepID=UPI0022424E90|nr:uncharacterized protein LOC127632032 [Xyrauchen texanus]